MTELAELLARVYDRAPRGIELGLSRVRAACDSLGRPERRWGVLHVAGTNGKGSVAAMTSLALQNAGYRVGLFTSPHLSRFAERIRVDQAPVDDALLAFALRRALAFEPPLTFFEITFVAALVAFAEARVDCAVLEVGMGGRLDATNVVEHPAATGVTRVALDHTAVLGSTLAAIAFEKASIAKHGAPMVVGLMPAEARDEVVRVSRSRGASRVTVLGEDVLVARQGDAMRVTLAWGEQRFRPALAGTHQLENAAMAAAMCWAATPRLAVGPAHVRDAVQRVCWPARLEKLQHEGVEVLIDAAHNPDGIASLVAHLRAEPVAPERTALVFGAMKDKSWPEMLGCMAPLAAHRFYVEPAGRAPAPADEIRATADGVACGTVQQALDSACRAVGRSGRVVVCGSIFLAAEARSNLLGLPRDPPVAL